MRTARREFPAELEREAVALREGGGRPRMRIAAELGLQPSWLEERAGGPGRGAATCGGRSGHGSPTGRAVTG